MNRWSVVRMRLRDFLNVLEQSDRIQIIQNGKTIYTGFLVLIPHDKKMDKFLDAEVTKFRPTPEIRHRQWKERGLLQPIGKDETPDYSFSDMQITLYNRIYI